MPTEKINLTLLATIAREVSRGEFPDVKGDEVRYFDPRTTGFHLRRLRTGRVTFNVQLARSWAVSLGEVGTWTSPDAARTFAQSLHERAKAGTFRKGDALPNRNQGASDAAQGDAQGATGPTLVEVFGLRNRETSKTGRVVSTIELDQDGTAGLFRTEARGGARRMDARNTEYVLDAFVSFIGPDRRFATLTPADVKSWVASMRRKTARRSTSPLSTVSLKKYMTALRGAFAWAVDAKLIAENPAKGISGTERVVGKSSKGEDKSKRPRFLRPEEEERLRAALRARDARLRAKYLGPREAKRADQWRTDRIPYSIRQDGCMYVDNVEPFVLLALNTGARKGGLLKARWKDVETFPYDFLSFEGFNQKKGQTYEVPLTPEAKRILDAWRPANARPNDLVFPAARGGVLKSISDDAWDEVRTAAGLKGGAANFRIHDTRHSFASNLVLRDQSLEKVGKLLGHKDPRMTKRYSHLDARDLIATIAVLGTPLPIARPGDAAAA